MKHFRKFSTKRGSAKSWRSGNMFGFAAAGAGVAAFGAHAGAQTIIQDNFTSGSQYGSNLASGTLSPAAVNLPGGSWSAVYQGDTAEFSGNLNGVINTHVFTPVDLAAFHNGSLVGLTLGAFNTGSLTISASVYFLSGSPNFLTAPAAATTFAAVGFNSASSPQEGLNNGFTGLEVTGIFGADPVGSTASLQEFINGVAVGSPAPFTGSYSAYTPTTLSYTINTATGAISGVSFGGSTTDYSSFFTTPGSFSSSYVSNVEIGGGIGNQGGFGAISNLLVVAVPEPSTNALLAGGLLAFGALHYRRRRRSAH